MATTSTRGPRRRAPLTHARVLQTALRVADRDGLDALSMRRLGKELRVEAMSLYKHVANKDEILDGLADLVAAEFELPSPELPWKEALRRSAISAHRALLRHPWAGGVLESRLNPGPTRLRYLEAVLARLRAAGFSPGMAGQAFMALDSHTYGFAMQVLAWPFESEQAAEVAAAMAAALPPDQYPNLRDMAALASDPSNRLAPDFEFGLDLVLDGLERALAGTGRVPDEPGTASWS